MLKKRIIFTLLHQGTNFFLSRNFRLQKIGNLKWLEANYNFSLMVKSVDEIILLDVSRNKQNLDKFCSVIKSLTKNCFIPISVGGKIDHLDKAKKYIDSGADKLVMNSKLFSDEKLIHAVAQTFGEQCIVGSVDFKKYLDQIKILILNGSQDIDINPSNLFKKLSNLPIGEVLLNSIDKDGTGNGFDTEILKFLPSNFQKPIIFSGGAGNYKHLLSALKNKKIDAVATANLLNFVGNGLQEARQIILRKGYSLSEWI